MEGRRPALSCVAARVPRRKVSVQKVEKTLICLGIALVVGLLMSRLAKLVHLPAVTAYLVGGLLIGPFCLGALNIPYIGFNSLEQVEGLSVITQTALGFIAFAIGNEFRLSQLRQTGKQATVIGIFQALTATLMVDLVLIGLHFFVLGDSMSIADAIVLGAIATATAPAATLMVVRQYKAKGELTDLLLPIVALDDAVGLIVFAVSFGVAKAINYGNYDMTSILVEPLLEIVLSILMGFVMGSIFSAAEKYFKSNSKRLSLSITFVILTVALSMIEFEVGGVKIGFSSLLVCMMLGTVFCNVCDFSAEIMEKTDRWTAPLYILFFVLSGAELELNVFSSMSVVIIGAAYILARSVGKWLGASVSAKFMKCPPKVQKWLGITLLPQAGVALGMSVTVAQTLGADGVMVRNIVLFGVLIYELVGPALTRIALTEAGDIQPKAEAVVSADD